MLTINQGQTGYVNPGVAAVDTGWTISGIYAIHTSCISGDIIALKSFGLVIGRNYTFKYTVDQYVSGSVNIVAGTLNGATRSANGTYTEQLVMTGNNILSFFSNGALRIGVLSFYDTISGPQTGTTISFNERENRWGPEYSMKPEMMLKFVDKFFAFKNGQLWQNNVSSVMMNFFGVQYSAQILFIPNQEYEDNKLWFNMRFDSVGGWYAPSLVIPSNDQFPNGMQSTLTKTNIKSIDGKLWADILRDMTDPNITAPDPQLQTAIALFQGRMMQGGYMFVTLQCDDPSPAYINSVEMFYINIEKELKP